MDRGEAGGDDEDPAKAPRRGEGQGEVGSEVRPMRRADLAPLADLRRLRSLRNPAPPGRGARLASKLADRRRRGRSEARLSTPATSLTFQKSSSPPRNKPTPFGPNVHLGNESHEGPAMVPGRERALANQRKEGCHHGYQPQIQ